MTFRKPLAIAFAAVVLVLVQEPKASAQEADCGYAYGVRDLRDPNDPIYGDVFDSCPQYWETYVDAGLRHDRHTNVQLHSPESDEECD